MCYEYTIQTALIASIYGQKIIAWGSISSLISSALAISIIGFILK